MKRDVRAASHWGQDAAAQPATVRLCEFAVWRKRSMRRHRISFGGKFESFIKVFEVEQKRRRRCVVPFRGHREVVFPGACASASLQSPPASRMSLESHYCVCSCCVLVGQKSETLQQPLPTAEYFHPFFSRLTMNSRWAMTRRARSLQLCLFVYVYRNNLLPMCSSFDSTLLCRLQQLSHGVRFKANLHSTPGWAMLTDLWNRTGIIFLLL